MSAVPKPATSDKPARKDRKVRRLFGVDGLVKTGKGKGFASKKVESGASGDASAKKATSRSKTEKPRPAIARPAASEAVSGIPPVSKPAQAVPSKGADAEWGKLGRRLGFLPVWKGLAVIAQEDPAPATPEAGTVLADRVRSLRQELVREGYPFPLVAVAATGLAAELAREVRRGGGRSVEVPSTFWKLDQDGRIAAISQKLPDPRLARSEKPARSREPVSRKPFDERRYRGPSSRLDGEEVSAWVSRLSDPSAASAELD